MAGPYNEEVYWYIYTLDPHKKNILERIERLKDPTQRQLAMTAAQHLRQEGRQEGMQQGMQQEKLSIAKHLLSTLHLDMQAVQEATGLSQEELMKLQEEARQ